MKPADKYIDDRTLHLMRRCGITTDQLPLTEAELHRRIHDRNFKPAERDELQKRLSMVGGLE